MGPLVDRVEPVVAVELLDRVVAGVAGSAEHLDRQAVALQAPLRRPGLRDRRKHLQQLVGRSALLRGGRRHRLVEHLRGIEDHRDRALGVGLLFEQHPAHVGVADDRHGRGLRVLGVQRTALDASPGVVAGVQEPGDAEGGRARTDADPCLVHHVEHVEQAAAFLPDEVSGGVVVVQRGVHRAAVAHLVVDADEGDAVAFREVAGLAQPLRDDEQRQSLHPGAAGAGEDEVDDVLGDLLVAAGDPHLVTAEAVRAVVLLRRGGGEVSEGGAGAGLGQVHRAEPATVEHRREELLLQFLGGVGADEVRRTRGEQGVGDGADVRGLEPEERRPVDRGREAEAAEFLVHRRGEEAGVRESIEGRLHLVNGLHLAVDERRFIEVAGAVVRREEVFAELPGDVQQSVEGLPAVLGVALEVGEGFDVEPVVEAEVDVGGVEDQRFSGVHGAPRYGRIGWSEL